MRSVVCSEWLRPWSAAGITAFLSEYPIDMTRLSPEYAAKSADFSPHTASGVVPAVTSAGNNAPQKTQKHISGPAALGTVSKKTGTQVSDGESNGHDASHEAVVGLAVDKWPQGFQQHLNKLSPSPVLWCYEALGEDLFGHSDPARSNCLKNLIGKLQFPKGTSVFWPPSVPECEDVALNKSILHQAIELLHPKLVITIGSGHVLHLLQGNREPIPFTQRLYKGRMIVFLPDFPALISAPSLFNQSVLYLRAISSQLAII